MTDSIIVHTNEIVLKGGNRSVFEKRLLENIKARFPAGAGLRFERRQTGVLIRADEAFDVVAVRDAEERLRAVFGIAYATFAGRCPADMDAIGAQAVAAVPEGTVFRVTTRRSDKRFPLTSPEVNKRIGARILSEVKGTKVDLHRPDVTVRIDIGDGEAFVAVRRIPGPGGLPTGTAGDVVALLSGGIDSPLAAWKVMRRGCRATFVHFHSYPHVGRESIEKVERLAHTLDRYQLDSTLYLVPFAEVQRGIVARCDPRMRVILYRRAMLRIAEAVAGKTDALALVTGDAIGQVASQTLENLRTVSAAVNLPIYRPLIGDDKQDIVDAARRIGTYDISIEPHDDCCSLFVPPDPLTRSMPEQAVREEAKFDHAAMEETALRAADVRVFGS